MSRQEQPVRVLNLLSRLSPGGGIPTVVRHLILRSAPSRVEHHICQLRPLRSDDLDEAITKRARFHSLDLIGRAPLGGIGGSAVANLRFAKIARRVKPDVVHLHTGTSLLAPAARLMTARRSAWVLDFHEPLQVRHSWRTTRAVYAMARWTGFVGVTHSMGVTRKIKHALGRRVPVFRIPLGVDTSTFCRPPDVRRSWKTQNGWDPHALLVTSVGRIAPMKGSPELLEVARRVLQERPEVQFAFIGRGPLLEELSMRARALRIESRVRFMSDVDDVRAALAASDIYLTTSRYEGFGIAVLEAMSSRLPVVATRIDGLEDLVLHGETGILVDAANLEGYVNGVVALVDDAARRAAFGSAGRRRAEREFDLSVMVSGYERLYRDLTACRQRRQTLKSCRSSD